MNKKVFVVVMAGLLCSKGLMAADGQPMSVMGEEMVVTSSRFEEPKKNLTSNITIIGKDEIAQSSAQDLGELLAEKNLGQVQKYPGTMTSVGIRGFRSETHGNDLMGKVLVLIDGRRAGTGNTAKIMTENVERIEIIQGPAAVQYGSAAIGGVVNVITKKGDNVPSFFVEQKGGSNEFVKTAAGVQGKIGKLDFASALSRSEAGDYKTGSGKTYFNTGYDEQVLANLNVGYEIADGHRIGFGYHSFDVDKAGSPSYLSLNDLQSYTSNNNHAIDVSYEGALTNKRWLWSTRYFSGMDSYQYVDPSTSYTSSSDVEQQGAQAQISFTEKSLLITAGVDWLNYELTSTLAPKWSKYNNPAVFLLAKYGVFEDRLLLSAGVRYDDYKVDLQPAEGTSRSTDNFAHQVGAAWQVNDVVKLRASYAEGFRMPSARELAGNIVSFGKTYIGNPNLNPEVSETWETGIDVVWREITSSLTWFSTDYTDMIETQLTAPKTYLYKNIGSTSLSGIEAEFAWKSSATTWNIEPYVNYSYLLEHKDNATGDDLLYTPEWNASTGVRLQHTNGLSAALNVTATGSSNVQDYESNSGKVITKGGFSVVNLSASKKFTLDKQERRAITIKAEVDNLLDRDYQYVKGYPMPGRTFVIGLRADI
uniref:TonB-dependent receptor-related protein n=1 Tax=Chlorobium chlorochromatii (strain CaD3) TaxID=340177 RepID=Q3ARU9_CHLCH